MFPLEVGQTIFRVYEVSRYLSLRTKSSRSQDESRQIQAVCNLPTVRASPLAQRPIQPLRCEGHALLIVT